ncbi:MAG: hypothetical protein ABIH83_01170 [Candidatus Micrarchaeota archaeon]
MNFLRGQYFSFDAILASVIFIMALSILMNHWFALRSQMNEDTDYLQSEAHRISDLMLGVGNPSNWYINPSGAMRAGFGVENSFPGNLVYQRVPRPNIEAASVHLIPGQNYDDSRVLMATSAEYYVVMRLAIADPDTFKYPPFPQAINVEFGNEPPANAEIAKVRRVVYVEREIGSEQAQYVGNMTVYTWLPGSRT